MADTPDITLLGVGSRVVISEFPTSFPLHPPDRSLSGMESPSLKEMLEFLEDSTYFEEVKDWKVRVSLLPLHI